MKEAVIALTLLKDNLVEIDGRVVTPNLPEGCIGVAPIFENKEMAYKHLGEDIILLGIEFDRKEIDDDSIRQ